MGLGDILNGEKIVAQRVQTDFFTGKQYVRNLTASDLRREAQAEFERDRDDDAIREAKLDADRD